jgi:hypothetical protein
MRAQFPIATGTWYHVMSFDITQCHERSVPKLSQTIRFRARIQGVRNGARDDRSPKAVVQRLHSPDRRLLEILVQSVPLLVERLATESQISQHPLKQGRRTRSKSQPKPPDQLHIERLWIRSDGVFGIQ